MIKNSKLKQLVCSENSINLNNNSHKEYLVLALNTKFFLLYEN